MVSRIMPPYCFSPLPEGNIRLLRLLPHQHGNGQIQCQLFDYPLQDSGKQVHLYEALSYTWGSSDKSQSIYINDCDFPVTPNLYEAVKHLRDRSLERVLWIDAVCINQRDVEERNRQVQSMAMIYARSSRVIVWLGKAETDGDRALEAIRVAAEGRSTALSTSKSNQQAILSLLRRPWFQRVWVLQEVAAARHILIRCGSTEIDGYAFCSGVSSLELSYGAYPDLETLIRSVNYLIQGATFRPKHATSHSTRFSLDIRPLGELIDMYHNRQASERHDKIYALLGMSSDDPGAVGLSPDYKISWKKLFLQLINFLLGEHASVETWDGREIAAIKNNGCILGHVTSVKSDKTSDGRQNLDITSRKGPIYSDREREWSFHWTVPASAVSIQENDLVCLLQGASNPTIIRILDDYCAIINITVTPPERTQIESGYIQWSEFLRSITTFPHELFLVWDWEQSPGRPKNGENHESLASNRLPKDLSTQPEDRLDKATRLRNIGLVFKELEKYRGARERLQRAIWVAQGQFGKAHPFVLTAMDDLALIYKENWQWEEAETLYFDLIQTRRQVLGAEHPSTLNSMVDLALTYRSQGGLEKAEKTRKAEKLEVMIDLLKRQGEYIHITEEGMIRTIRAFDEEVMVFLLERRGNEVQITEDVFIHMIRSFDREMIKLLLEKSGGEIRITERIVKAAAENKHSGKGVMLLVLDHRWAKVQITEDAVIQIAASFDQEVIQFLLEQRKEEVEITEGVVRAAVVNEAWGKEVVACLLESGGDKVQGIVRVIETEREEKARGTGKGRRKKDKKGKRRPSP